jgi:pyrimidine operon attenuation protein/uracil phosphoribosyltransferase
MIPKEIENMGVDVCYDLKEGVANADVVLMLRIQRERQNKNYFPSLREYAKLTVSIRVSPFTVLEDDPTILIVSALNRFSASSKDTRVRVLGSKNKLTTVLPLRVGTFLTARVETSLKESAMSKMVSISSQVRSWIITLYRDDLSEKGVQAIVQTTEIDFDVTGTELFLIDDVLFSGRTVRAAMDALIDFGRPKYIKLCVLVERGYRELPLQPDFVGFSIETEYTDKVLVRLSEVDGEDKVVLGKASDFLEQ